MNFLVRAWKNVTRRMTKSILLAVTFFMIGNLVILGLGVSQAAENAKVLTRKKMKAIVSYEIDYEKYSNYVMDLTDENEIEEAYKNSPTLDKEVALKLSQDPRVKAVNYLRSSFMYSVGFENYPLGNEEQKANNNFISVSEDGNVYREPNLYVFSNIFPSMIEFEDGTNTIVEGRFYTQEEINSSARVAVISKELADLNNFKIGDTFTVTSEGNNYLSQSFPDFNVEQLHNEYEIVGIYTTTREVDTTSQSYQYMSPMNSPKNYIYVPGTTFAQDQFKNAKLLSDLYKDTYGEEGEGPTLEMFETPEKVVYLLDDPLNVDRFVEENSTSTSEYVILNANNETFKELSKPLDTLSFFANVIVWIVSINAIVIITLVTALTLKTREFEIGVLLSLGVSKVKVIGQLFMELLIVAIFGFTLSIVSGSLVAGRVGDEVLKFQQSRQEEKKEDPWGFVITDTDSYFTEISQDELLSEYKVSVNPILVLEIYVFGVGVVLFAILIPSAMIMRLNPKQILLNTN